MTFWLLGSGRGWGCRCRSGRRFCYRYIFLLDSWFRRGLGWFLWLGRVRRGSAGGLLRLRGIRGSLLDLLLVSGFCTLARDGKESLHGWEGSNRNQLEFYFIYGHQSACLQKEHIRQFPVTQQALALKMPIIKIHWHTSRVKKWQSESNVQQLASFTHAQYDGTCYRTYELTASPLPIISRSQERGRGRGPPCSRAAQSLPVGVVSYIQSLGGIAKLNDISVLIPDDHKQFSYCALGHQLTSHGCTLVSARSPANMAIRTTMRSALSIFVAAFVVTVLAQSSSPTQGIQFGLFAGSDLRFPLTVTQCEPALIYFNTTQHGYLPLYTLDDVPFLLLYFPLGIGYLEWICDIPAGYVFRLGQYFTVQPGPSSSCLHDITTTYPYASYATTDFHSYTEHPPITTTSSFDFSATTVPLPTGTFSTIIANPDFVVSVPTTTVATSSSQFTPPPIISFTATETLFPSRTGLPSSKRKNKAAIAGGVVASIILILVALAILFFFVRDRRKPHTREEANHPSATNAETP